MPTCYNLIVQSKVPAFLSLFDKLEHHHGSISAACRASGVNSNAYYRMKQTSFLTADNARKILNAHKRLAREVA